MAKENAKYLEYKVTGDVFEYSGRIYPGREGNGKVKREWGISLALNGVLTIKGVWLKQTESGKVFLTFPQYKASDGYKSYIFTDKSLNADMTKVVKEMCKRLKIKPVVSEDDIAEAPAEDLPF